MNYKSFIHQQYNNWIKNIFINVNNILFNILLVLFWSWLKFFNITKLRSPTRWKRFSGIDFADGKKRNWNNNWGKRNNVLLLYLPSFIVGWLCHSCRDWNFLTTRVWIFNANKGDIQVSCCHSNEGINWGVDRKCVLSYVFFLFKHRS